MRRAAVLRALASGLAATVVLIATAHGPHATATAETPPPAKPSNCQNTGSFENWLRGFRQEAAAQGVTQGTLSAVLDDMTVDHGIIARDRRQSFFGQSFVEFRGKLISRNRITNGQRQLEKYHSVFARAEKEYGVPGPVITGFWALESDFGAGMGKLPVLRSLATLAYDCRRGEFFTREFIAALKIIDRGDLRPDEMIGSWAGELGQTQFLPTHYFNYAVDYDGDGHRNLLRSAPDVIGSTANYIATGLKWRRGEPWLQEVRVPPNLPWEQTDLSTKHPRSKWAAWGVTYPDGRPLPNDDLPASVLLPMGRTGPAFMAYANFAAYTEWNNSLIYATTAGYLATRIAGAAPMRQPAQPVAQLQFNEMKELQQLLARAGFNVGKIDGVLGQQSRIAVKAMQQKYGMPADSWPTAELLARMRGPGAQAQPAGAMMPQAR